jgi:hypothetical protein
MTEKQIQNDQYKHLNKQNRLFYCTLMAFAVFIISWTVSGFRHLFGFDPNWAGENFAFNVTFLFPATIICAITLFFTGGLTIGYWKILPSLTKKILTVTLSYSVLIFITYTIILLLRQH